MVVITNSKFAEYCANLMGIKNIVISQRYANKSKWIEEIKKSIK